MTRFGSLLAGAVRDGFAKDVDDVNSVDYGGCKSEVPEADTTSITAIIDQQREEGDAKAAMTLAREYTMEFVDEEHAAAKREEEDLAYAERLDIELKDELVAERKQHEFEAERRHIEYLERDGIERDARYAECEAKLEQEEADAKVAERRDRELKDGDCAKAAQLELDGAEAFERGLAEAKGLEEAKGSARIAVEASGKVVKVVATRASAALRASNWASKDAGPKTITLKFELVCPKSASDVSYDYDCEAGLLHLFLDGIQLASLDEATRAKTLTSLRARLAQSAAAKVASFRAPAARR
ncbi:hypothetical protein JL720_2532 [Aureococcus anophagefferens]|nr:hypothetical protein JL720_2532 [Aureococcus anophagefferens]